MWLPCSWSKACHWREVSITILLPLSTMLSISARSSQNAKYGCFLPLLLSVASHLWCMLSALVILLTLHHISYFISSDVFQNVHVCFYCINAQLHAISWSLFSQWFCHNGQSAMYSSGPDLYTRYMLYWHTCHKMHLSHCESVATF